MIILLSSIAVADVTDLLQGTRLQTMPAGGTITIETQADKNDETNYFLQSLQLPNGDVPYQGIRVPAGAEADRIGVLDERTKFMASFLIQQGGHAVLSFDETGDAHVTWRIRYAPL